MNGPVTRIDGSHDASPLPVSMFETTEEGNHEELSASHRNAPQPDAGCLYGLIGEVAQAGSHDTETNAFAIAANFMAYLSCAIGRGVYLPIGNTRHHARLFCLHIGRSGRGRKGDAVSLVLRIDEALRAADDQLVKGFLRDKEFLVFSPSSYNAVGLGTTQLYNRTLVYNHKRHGVFRLGNRQFDFRVKPRFPKKLSREFLYVDLLNNLEELAEDRDVVLSQARSKLFSGEDSRVAFNSTGSLGSSEKDALTSIVGLFEIVKDLYNGPGDFDQKRPSEEVLDKHLQLCKEFFDSLVNHIPEYHKVFMDKTAQPADFRTSTSNHLLFRPIGQRSFARATQLLISRGASIEDAVTKLAKADLNLLSEHWAHILWNPVTEQMMTGALIVGEANLLELANEKTRNQQSLKRLGKLRESINAAAQAPGAKSTDKT